MVGSRSVVVATTACGLIKITASILIKLTKGRGKVREISPFYYISASFFVAKFDEGVRMRSRLHVDRLVAMVHNPSARIDAHGRQQG